MASGSEAGGTQREGSRGLSGLVKGKHGQRPGPRRNQREDSVRNEL